MTDSKVALTPETDPAVNGRTTAFPSGSDGMHAPEWGLSKREYFAAMAMQAILTGAVTRGCPSNEWIDQSMAVRCADALLKELAK